MLVSVAITASPFVGGIPDARPFRALVLLLQASSAGAGILQSEPDGLFVGVQDLVQASFNERTQGGPLLGRVRSRSVVQIVGQLYRHLHGGLRYFGHPILNGWRVPLLRPLRPHGVGQSSPAGKMRHWERPVASVAVTVQLLAPSATTR